MIPFAVVGSDQEYQVNGKRILGRKTKWGTIEGNAHKSSNAHMKWNSMFTYSCHYQRRLKQNSIKNVYISIPTDPVINFVVSTLMVW